MPRKPRDPNIDSQAAAIARAAWEVPEGRYSVQFRARIPKEMAVEIAGQTSTERGDVWADGVRVRKSLDKLMRLVSDANKIDGPSYIVNDDDITVAWGPWVATASTTVEAVLMVIEEMYPDESGVLQQKPSGENIIL